MNRVLRIDEEKPEMHISVQGYTLSPIWTRRVYRICYADALAWSVTCRTPQSCPRCTTAGTRRNDGRRLTKYRR